jgi:hypothetical protein
MKTQKKSHEHEQPNENNTKYYHCSIEKERARYLEPKRCLMELSLKNGIWQPNLGEIMSFPHN